MLIFAYMTQGREVQIVIPGVPLALVKQIDELARVEHRSRAGEVRQLLEEIVGLKRKDKAA